VTDEPHPVAERFGRTVRTKRESVGVSQEDLADRAGLHRTYVSLIERGRRTASIAVVERLAKALGTSMAELMKDAER
jgi:transcriptional regulator with XRE-family HTH domain